MMAASIGNFKHAYLLNQCFRNPVCVPSQQMFHTASILNAGGQKLRRDNKYKLMLEKKMTGATKTRKSAWHFNTGEASPFAGANVQRKITEGSRRRAENLSKVLYDYVSSLINSGEIIPQLPVLGFQVNRVELHPDLSHLKIYWEASGTSSDKYLEALLVEAPSILRRALVGLRVMGHIPTIHFVKDVSLARAHQVEHLLALADMGPDHTPTKLGEELKDMAKMQAGPDLQKQFADLTSKFRTKEIYGPGTNVYPVSVAENHSSGIELSSDDTEMLNPNDALEAEMRAIDEKLRSDVYGIDHQTLTQKLTATKIKARRAVQESVKMPEDSVYDSLPLSLTTEMYKIPKVKLEKTKKLLRKAEQQAIREMREPQVEEILVDYEPDDYEIDSSTDNEVWHDK